MEEYIKMVSGEDYNPNVDYLQGMRAEPLAALAKNSGEPDDKVREEILFALIDNKVDKCIVLYEVF